MRRPVLAVEQCRGCGADVVQKTKHLEDPVCSSCRSKARRQPKAIANPAAVQAPATCPDCGGLGVLGPAKPCLRCGQRGVV